MNAHAFAFKTTREDIEALAYLKDPRRAAHYLGIPQVQVEHVWAEMREPRQRCNEFTYDRESSGLNTHAESCSEARAGSDRLKEATLAAMIRWADRNGTTIDDAARFLLSGVKTKDFTQVKQSSLSQGGSEEQRMVDGRVA